jgi:hypothetical protein
MAERNKVLKKDYDPQTKTATILFVESGNKLEINLDNLRSEIVIQAALHGLNQRLGDAASGLQGEEAEEAVMAVAELIQGGNWKAERTPGEARPSLIAEAVFEFKRDQGALGDETLESIIARYSGKDGAAARAKAMQRPEVAAIVEKKKIERAQAKLAKLQEKAGAVTGDVASL